MTEGARFPDPFGAVPERERYLLRALGVEGLSLRWKTEYTPVLDAVVIHLKTRLQVHAEFRLTDWARDLAGNPKLTVEFTPPPLADLSPGTP